MPDALALRGVPALRERPHGLDALPARVIELVLLAHGAQSSSTRAAPGCPPGAARRSHSSPAAIRRGFSDANAARPPEIGAAPRS